MSRVSTIKMTARQFLELGEDPPGVRLELVDGEVAVSPSPVPRHSYSVGALYWTLRSYIEEHDLGEILMDVDTIFGEHDVRRPDIFFFTKARRHYIGETAIEGPPDLVVEVIIPGTEQTDRREKFDLYASGKVKNYWIVDPAKRTMEAFTLRAGKYAGGERGSRSDVVKLPPFAKLEIPLAKLWRAK
jgi:Uma2 family endonuclease